MARIILTNTDFNQNEIQNARVQNLASAPGSPVEGQIYYDTTLDKLRVYNAALADWVNLDGSNLPDNSVTSAKIVNGAILNEDINASAGIVYSKLTLTGSIVNADIAAAAGIAVTKLAVTATDRILGRDTAGAGAVEELTVGGGVEFTGSGGIQTSAFTGDVTKAAGGTATTIANDAVTTVKINNNAVTLAKLADIATDSLIGRDTASTGDPEVISVGGGIEFTGSGGIQVSAFTGDVTKTAGGTSTTIANDAVTNGKLANMANSTIKGRATGGTGDPEDLTASQVKTILAIVPGDITGLQGFVNATPLDDLADPDGPISMNGQALTNLIDPTDPQDAATKNYVDLARQGIRLKEAVLAATTANITLSGTQTIDGIALQAGDRVLVKDQSTASQNGIYVVAAGAWSRSTDANTAAELNDGATVWVSQGTTLANTTWSQINTITTLGTDAVNWAQQGSATTFLGGAGIDITGNTISVNAGTGITTSGDAVNIDTAVVARKFNQAVGDGAATSYVITHGLNNQWVTVQVFRNSGAFDQVECDIELTSSTTVTLRFAIAPTNNQYRVVITG